MKKLILTILSAAAFMTSNALAATINYTLTSGTDTIRFTLPETPTPSSCALSSSCFSLLHEAVTIDGITDSDATVSFYTPANLGGLTILEGSTVEVNNDGPGSEQLFTGTLANPTLESFTNLQLLEESAYSPVYDEAFLLNASGGGVVTPEPSEAMLIAFGLSLCCFAFRRRRNKPARD